MQTKTILGDHLRAWGAATPAAEALVWHDVRMTYADYDEAVRRAVNALHGLGLQKGDRLAMISSPRPEVMVLFLAASELGAVFMGLNPRASLLEIQTVVRDARPKLLVAPAAMCAQDTAPILDWLRGEVEATVTLDGTDGDTLDYSALLAAASAEPRPPAAGPEDPIVLVYTSGSTGKPKGALITHRNLLSGMAAQAEPFRQMKPNRRLFTTSIHHLGSVGNCGTAGLILGGALIFMDAFSPSVALSLIQSERITVWGHVPTMFLMEMARPEWDATDVSSVQVIWFAGSYMPMEAVERLAQFNIPMVTGYGLTETAGPVTVSRPGTSLTDLSDTIGEPVPGTEVRVTRPDGVAADPGEEGEIWVRGPSVFSGYFNNPEATRAAFAEGGWFRTGDLAVVDGKGLIRITGRLADVFKSGGVNIYPREIEEVLQAHPDVAIACVVSVPDPVYQEVGYAYIVPQAGARMTEAELKRHCAEQLTRYKAPRHFEFRSELPIIGLGKIDRARLRREAREAA